MRHKIKRALFVLLAASCGLWPAACQSRAAVGSPSAPAYSASGAPASSQVQSVLSVSSASSAAPLVIDGFVRVTDLDPSIVVDLKYATADNFTHQKVYPTNVCVLRLATAQKLAKANTQLQTMGCRIKVWDAYRPVSVQKIFWSIEPDTRFVANPSAGGSVHNRGCAVDVTLVDLNGNEPEMPSGFDDFTEKAYRSNTHMTAQAKTDVDLLTKAMTENGFLTISAEWWHFSDSDLNQYQNADVDLALFQ